MNFSLLEFVGLGIEFLINGFLKFNHPNCAFSYNVIIIICFNSINYIIIRIENTMI